MTLNKLGELKNAETGETVAEMFGPPNALSQDDPLSSGLYLLSETIIRGLQPDRQGGGLGGEFGYGADFENEVFLMRPYCWCEQADCLWCTVWLSNETDATAAESEAHRDKQTAEIIARFGGQPDEYQQAPHFWHKPSGLKVRWYKWIGRDMEINRELSGAEWHKILVECYESLPTEAREKAKAAHDYENTPEYLAEREAAQQALFAAMMRMHDEPETGE